MRLPSHLHRNRLGVFGFRVVIPSHLRSHFRQGEFRVTLRTRDPARACILAQQLAAFFRPRLPPITRMNDEDAQAASLRLVDGLQTERDRLLAEMWSILHAQAV